MRSVFNWLRKQCVWALLKYQTFVENSFLPIWRVFVACRVSALAVVFCSALLYLVGAGEEALRATAEKSDLAAIIPTVLLGFCAWLCSRLMVDHQFDFDTGKAKSKSTDHVSDLTKQLPIASRRAVKWLPRLFGILPISVATLSLAYAVWLDKNPQSLLSFIFSAVALAVLFAFFILRRAIANKMRQRKSKQTKGKALFGENGTGVYYTYFLIGFATALICAFNLSYPTSIGDSLGPIGATMFAASFFVFTIGFAVYLIELSYSQSGDNAPTRRFPILIFFAIIGAILSMLGDPYAIRTLPDRYSQPKDLANAIADFDQSSGCNGPLVIVATSGGASRAAYWTSTVLSGLYEKSDHFRKCLVAISSVSGGSVGATEFVAAMNNDPAFDGSDQNYVIEASGGDFLGAALGGLFVNDGVFAFLHIFNLPSRATSLEMAFENSWRSAASTAKKDQLKELIKGNFFNLWKERHAWPILLINGTHAQTGRRIITSNIDTKGIFVDTDNFFALTEKTIAASTAIHNSARFSYVSPAGHLPQKKGAKTDRGYIIDGGYYENMGAETALELAQAVQRLRPNQTFEIIQISSDAVKATGPSSPTLSTCRRPPDRFEMGLLTKINPVNWQYLMPLNGLLETRNARGVSATQQLACAASDNTAGKAGVVFYQNMEMALPKDQSLPPLSWALANKTKENIRGLIAPGGTQFETFNNILKQFNK